MNYYERHLGDYAKKTRHLTMLEHGAYTLLLDLYYSTEKPIPADQVHRHALARTDDEKSAVDVVLKEFFTLIDGAWHKGRCNDEIDRAQKRIKAARANGKEGGRPRRTETQSKPSGLISETQVKAHQTPDSRHQDKNLIRDEGRRVGRKPPRHGAASADKGVVYIVKGTSEWDAYAADYREANFVDPVENENGGKWFKTAGCKI